MKVKNIRLEIQDEAEFVSEVKRDLKKIAKGENVKNRSTLSFESLKAMRMFITDERLKILKVVRKYHPESIYELAKILKRDTKNVSDDVHYLSELGLLDIKESKGDGRKKTTPVVNYQKIMVEIPV
jgi:predicted transcriptional regulator